MCCALQAMERAVSGDMKRVSEYFGELHEAGDPAKMMLHLILTRWKTCVAPYRQWREQ